MRPSATFNAALDGFASSAATQGMPLRPRSESDRVITLCLLLFSAAAAEPGAGVSATPHAPDDGGDNEEEKLEEEKDDDGSSVASSSVAMSTPRSSLASSPHCIRRCLPASPARRGC